MVKALVVANNEVDQHIKDQIESKMDSCPLNPNATSLVREKSCLILDKGSDVKGNENPLGFEIPKTDIVASLPADCIDRMVRMSSIFCHINIDV